MIFKALFLLLISVPALSFDKDFKLINDRVPYEFVRLFNSMLFQASKPKDQIRLVGLCKEIDENLNSFNKDHIFILMKTEIIKNVLEHKFRGARHVDLNEALIIKLNEELKKKASRLTPFSSWIWRSIIAELTYRQKTGLITAANFNPTTFSGEKRTEAVRLARYQRYLSPWLELMQQDTPEDFNALTKEIAWSILERINQRALLFKRYANPPSEVKVSLFNIPEKLLRLSPEDVKKMQNDEIPPSLKELSHQEKVKAQDEMDKVAPEDMSTVSEDVAKELEKNIDEPKKPITPQVNNP